MDLMKGIVTKSKNLRTRLIFPEGGDERILKAVGLAVQKKIIDPIILGDKNKIKLKNVEVVNPAQSPFLEKYAALYTKKTGTPLKTARLIVQRPLFYAALAVASGDAEGMVAGAAHTSAEVILVAKNIIGLQKGISTSSSFFLMAIPGFNGGEKGSLIYADASVNPNPNAEMLADIAVISGKTAENLFSWRPRIALLSFSTKGSANHPDVCKVIEATKIAKRKSKKMAFGGEFQADSALVMSTAQKKIKGPLGPVAGRANILIFPDLDAGNIAYKLTQILAKAKAYGPLLQGFAKPVSDLSRGATTEDIFGVIALLSYWSKRWQL